MNNSLFLLKKKNNFANMPDNAAILKCIVIYIYMYVSYANPSITQWVQNVSMLGLFFNSSQWYIATILPFFLFVL